MFVLYDIESLNRYSHLNAVKIDLNLCLEVLELDVTGMNTPLEILMAMLWTFD